MRATLRPASLQAALQASRAAACLVSPGCSTCPQRSPAGNMLLDQLIDAARGRFNDRSTSTMLAGLLSQPVAAAPRHPLAVLSTIAVQPRKCLAAAVSLLQQLPIHPVHQAAIDCYAGEHRLPQDLKISMGAATARQSKFCKAEPAPCQSSSCQPHLCPAGLKCCSS